MLINALSKFGITDLKQISKMSFDEFFLRSEAYQIKTVEEQQNLAMQAWLNQAVQATTGSDKHPKPKYTKFDQFFNTQKYENEIHKNFNPDYVIENETQEEKEQNEQDIIMQRFKKLQAYKEKHKKDNH